MQTAKISDESHPLCGETVDVIDAEFGEMCVVRLNRDCRGYRAGDVLHLPTSAVLPTEGI